MKVKLAIAGLLLVLLSFGGCIAVTYGGRHAAEEVVLPRVAERIGAELEWSQVNSSLGQVTIDNLQIRIPDIPELQLSLRQLTVSYRLWPLLSGDVEISSIAVDSPDIELARLDPPILEKLRNHWRRINQRSGSSSANEAAGSGRPSLSVLSGTFTAHEIEGTTLDLSGIAATVADHGRFDVQVQSSTITNNDGRRELVSVGMTSVVGIIDSVTGLEIDEASIEGVDLRLDWGQSPDRLVEALRAYRDLATGRSDGQQPTDDNDSEPSTTSRQLRLPSSITVSQSQAQIVWRVDGAGEGNGGEEQEAAEQTTEQQLGLIEVEGEIFLGSDTEAPSVELTGRLEPGQGRFGLTVTINDEGHPSARAELSSLRIGRLASGLSLSGLAFDESSLLDADLTMSRGEDGGVRFRGETSADGVTLQGRLIASEPVTDVRLRAVSRGVYRHDQRSITLDDTHLWLNGIETRLSGSFTRHEERTAIDITTELYPVHCAALFEATPEAMRDRVDGLTLDGTISGRVQFSVDTERPEDLVLEVDIQNGCRAIGSGVLDIERLYGAFLHHVDLPDDDPYEFRTGPGSGSWASLGYISPYMIAAVQTTEDGRFYYHNGFNLREIRRALIRDIRAGGPRFGASTISQQLARNLYLGRERTLSRKLQEAVLTWFIEDHLSKDELLAIYLNIIEFGPRIFGIRHATMHYFGRQPNDLSPREAAFLAKLLPNPVDRHEQTYEEGELSPRWRAMVDRLLGVMHERRALTQSEYQSALEERIDFHRSGEPPPPHRRWPSRPPFLGRRGGDVDEDIEPERWLELDGEAHIPAPADLLDDFEF